MDFPTSCLKGTPKFSIGSGGSPKYQSANLWWTDWWNRSIRDVNGMMAGCFCLISWNSVVNTVDNHESTLGYELLSEPQVHSSDQWQKIGILILLW